MQRSILLLITDLETGGTPTVVRELAIRLRRCDPSLQVQVACLAKWGPVADQLTQAGIAVTAFAAVGSSDFRILPRLIRLIRAQRFDTVFSFLVHANTLAAAASLWVRNVRSIQAIQTTQPFPKWHWHVQRLAAHAAEIIVVPSPSVAIAAMEWSNIPKKKIAIIPNAIDPTEFESSTVPANNPRPYPISFIGRLDPIKDIPTLLTAVARLGDLVHLNIYGDGTDRGRIESVIARLQLSHKVMLHGSVPHPHAALVHSGLLVLPSLAEGFGLVLIEAMAAGVPVVATNVAGIRDVIRDDQTGILVPPANPAALAAAIQRVVADVNLRQHLIAAARKDIRDRFTWDTVLKEYKAIF